MGLGRYAAIMAMAIVIFAPGPGVSAQSGFDIDLRELRPASADKKPQQSSPASLELDLKELRSPPPAVTHAPALRKRHVPAEKISEAADAGVSSQESIHVVRPGEHLFLILMKGYGLSNQAAERLIPEVMRLNLISSPAALKVGQRLRIPLPTKSASRTTPAARVEAAPRTPAPEAAPVTAPPARPAPAAAHAAGGSGITITAAPPCQLARDMVEKLGLQIPPPDRLKNLQTVSAAHAGRSVTVVCGLTLAERYTYERLLAHADLDILAFEGGESEERVVEKLATRLGLVFRKRDPDAATLPLTYIFAPFGSWTTELALTIQPAPAAPAR